MDNILQQPFNRAGPRMLIPATEIPLPHYSLRPIAPGERPLENSLS
jgi:hypothetical protein